MSEQGAGPVVVTDYDECQVSEGLEVHRRGSRFSPYPAFPPPGFLRQQADKEEGA